MIPIINQIVSQRKSEFTILLLKALPFLHFMRGDCTPNEQRVVKPSKVEWLDRHIQLQTVHFTMLYEKSGLVEINCD